MLVLENSAGRSKTKQFHVIPVCLRNQIVTDGAGTVLMFPNTAENDIVCF